MKYEVVKHGERLEAIAAHSGYRIRISTVAQAAVGLWPVSVHVRGSETEDEVQVQLPKQHHASAEAALAYGYDGAVQWIDARDHRR